MRTVPRFCDVYPGICITTEEKARKTLSQGSRRMPVGTKKTEYTEESTEYYTPIYAQVLQVVYFLHVSPTKTLREFNFFTVRAKL